MGIKDQWQRFKARFRKPAMVGVPPSARQVPAHPELHAVDFAGRYAEPLDYHAAQIMTDLGVPHHRIGASAPLHGIKHATFHWRERTGGGVSADGRITLDSDIRNEELLDKDYGLETGRLGGSCGSSSGWRSSLRTNWPRPNPEPTKQR